MTADTTDVAIDELLAELGLRGADARRARTILEEAQLTNPRKQRIATSKASLAREAIDRRLQRLCHHCAHRAREDGRTVVAVPAAACSVCNGSNNARAVREMVAACREAGIERLVVVGGSPNMRQELLRLVGSALVLRLVDGTSNPSGATARTDIAWADLVVVLGRTQLAHKVSNLYTRNADARRKLVHTSRRGIEAIADDIARSDVIAATTHKPSSRTQRRAA